MQDPRDLVQDLIHQDKVVLFSKTYCPECDKIKSVFNSLGVKYTAVEVDEHYDGQAIIIELWNLTHMRRVPNIYFGGKNIGGLRDLEYLQEEGILIERLKEAGAL